MTFPIVHKFDAKWVVIPYEWSDFESAEIDRLVAENGDGMHIHLFVTALIKGGRFAQSENIELDIRANPMRTLI